MRNAVIGLIIGIVAGIVLGTTVIAPRLAQNVKKEIGLAESDGSTSKDLPDTAATAEKETGKPTDPAPDVVRLNMASAFAEGLVGHGSLAKRLEKNVWRVSDGRLDIRFHPPGALVKDADALDAVISGAIDAYFTDMDALASRDPSMTLLAGPPFGASVAAYLGWMAEGGGREQMLERMAEMGIAGAVCGIVPHAAGGWFKKPLKTAGDLKGMRIRATGVQGDLYKKLGADIVDFSYPETLIAMESGLVDGAQLSAPHVDLALGAARGGWTYYVPGWRTPARVFVLAMSKDKWDGLSEVQRSQVQTACSDNIRHAIAEGEALQFDALKEIIRKGADVRPWPAEVTDAVGNAWRDMAAEMQKSSRPYSRIQKSWRQFIKGQSIWEELARPK
ncbi:MAG: TRAP transporter substrate-binding protein DctP [Rhodospirillales bacterium]|nr:TRAP transporter substrate-binding protein DctP [Rhodospirillales bacterium]